MTTTTITTPCRTPEILHFLEDGTPICLVPIRKPIPIVQALECVPFVKSCVLCGAIKTFKWRRVNDKICKTWFVRRRVRLQRIEEEEGKRKRGREE